MIAKVIELLGDDRVRVACPDGKIRIARIPGRYRRKLWLRVGDYVIIVPWDFQTDEKCDVVWRYRNNEVDWLQRHGVLKTF